MNFSSVSSLTSYFAALPADWIILGSCALFLSFDALRAGPARVTALSIALPIALYLSTIIGSTAYIGSLVPQTSDALVAGTFVVLAVGLFVVFYRLVDTGMDSLHVGHALLAGAAASVVLLTVLLQLPETTVPWSPSAVFTAVFGQTYMFFWTVGAYIALALVRR